MRAIRPLIDLGRSSLVLTLAASLGLAPALSYAAASHVAKAPDAKAHDTKAHDTKAPDAKPPAAKSPEMRPIDAKATGADVEILLGKADKFTRIEFKGAQPQAVRRDGPDLVLRFGAVAEPNLALLHSVPPPYLKDAKAEAGKGGMIVRLTLTEGATAKFGRDDGRTYVNLMPEPAPDKPAEGAPAAAVDGHADQAPDRKASAAPASGVVRMHAELQGKNLLLRFPWRTPVGAAVFRRGEAIWVVFDTAAKLDLSEAPKGLVQTRGMQAVKTATATAVRIVAASTVIASASADVGTWTITLGPESVSSATPVQVLRDDAAGPAALTARMAGSTGVFWIDDPAVGDRFAAVTALAPVKALPARRDYVEATLLASTQGMAIEPDVDDLTVHAEGDLVRIGRPQGLALSHTSAEARGQGSTVVGAPQPTSLPALIDFDGWSKLGHEGFLPRYRQLMDASAEEIGKGKAAGVQSRLALARFLVGSELSFEAIGVLNALAKTNPTLLGDPEFRGLRGAARAMAGRYKDAQADFSTPVVAADPASALWRGYIANKLADYPGARDQFARGRSALAQFAPKWRSRFARADAESALGVGDLGAARNALQSAAVDHLEKHEAEALELDRARLLDASGQVDQAVSRYDQVSQSTYGALAAPAILRATEIKLNKGKLPLKDAVAVLDSLRYQWRGDATELETIRTLGKIYVARGRYREALEALRSAGRRFPDLPTGVAVQNDLSAAFKNLFLNGLADGLEPIQALALFYDFRELTPIGADGDFMVRKMVRRLVDVDLLDQAVELLKYQVDNRLDGVAKADVATDLAMIDLMNRRPEAALLALNSSRTTLLPTALNAERRMLEARSLMELGRNDHALEVLGKDVSPESMAVKAEIAWRQHSWATAGQMLETQLGDRWKSALPLTPDEENRLLRAGVAYSLAEDQAGLTRLRTRYAKVSEAVRAPEALRVALSGADTGPLTAADFMRAASDADTFAGWVARMKKRFREKPTPVSAPPAPAAAPAKPAAKPAVAANTSAKAPPAKG
ncbi:MAG: endoglucanase [Caulobacteraceae bacterium]